MGIRNDEKNAQKLDWIVLTDIAYRLAEIADEYHVRNTMYDVKDIGPKEWHARKEIYYAGAVQMTVTRREFLNILKDFKDSYPDADIVVMQN